MTPPKATNHPVILFDGVCNLCNSAVQFIIKNDPEHRFRFASLQSSFGQQLLQQYGLNTTSFSSFILLDKGKIYTKSTAALRVAQRLQSVWKVLYAFMIVPSFLRDGVYTLIANNRYKWFGKKEACWLPSPKLKQLFFE